MNCAVLDYMKCFVSLFIILLPTFVFSYEVKWVKQPKINAKDKIGALKTQSIYGMFFSRELPIKKVVTITNTEIISKKEEGSQCEDSFFPTDEMKLEGVREMNLSGVRAIRGLWREGFKYVVISCANTRDGYKVSSAFIRLPFLKRTLRSTTLIQLGFFNDSKLKMTEERRVYLDFLIDSLQEHLVPSAHGFTDTSDLIDTLDGTRRSIDSLNETISETNGILERESQAWQLESGKWREESAEWRDVASDFLTASEQWRESFTTESGAWRDESGAWREESVNWREQSDAWREQLGETQNWLSETFTSGNLFKLALSTAAGAAIGSFGMNMVLNGITSGVGNLINVLKNRHQLNEAEIRKLKQNFSQMDSTLGGLEAELDRLVMSLPLIHFLSEGDPYNYLENILRSERIKTASYLDVVKEEDDEKLRELSRQLRRAKRSGNEEMIGAYQRCIDSYDLSEQVETQKKLESIDGLLGQINQQYLKNLKLPDFCSKLGDILRAWEAADVQLKIARLRLMNEGPGVSGIVRDRYDELMKLAKKSKRKVKRNIKKTKARANQILKTATKDIRDNFLETYNHGAFKEDFSQCRYSWCHQGGMFGEGVSCETILMDIQQGLGGSSSGAQIPGNLYDVLMSEGAIEDSISRTDFNQLPNIEHLRAMDEMSKKYEDSCFNQTFKQHYSTEIDESIRCENFDQVTNFDDLVKCSADHIRISGLYAETMNNLGVAQNNLSRMGSQGSPGVVVAAGAMEELSQASAEARDDTSVFSGLILEDYKNKEIIKEYCPLIQ